MYDSGATPSRRRRLLSYFFIILFFIWVVVGNQAASAMARPLEESENPDMGAVGSKEKYFNGRSLGSREFEENKRTVPSCPDPLHN
ncbi:putative Clavata3/esr-related 43 [Cucumis melo var. makuwa]|nr:putative Clavata3/esr-related 43 [Cucumis melo var. makuwa]